MPSPERRRVFGEAAETYARVRPGYPEAAIEAIAEFGGLSQGSRVLEVGSGTGIATLSLLRLGLDVIGLEPDPEMAAVARRRLASWPRHEVVALDFEEWDPAGAMFAAVVSAQAWHWVDPGVRYQKAATVLAPGGYLALLWNRAEPRRDPLRLELDVEYRRWAPTLSSLPPGELDLDRRPEIIASGRFERPRRLRFPFDVEYSAGGYRRLMETQSDHRMLPQAQRRQLLDAVYQVVRRHGGRYRVRWVTLLYLAHLRRTERFG